MAVRKVNAEKFKVHAIESLKRLEESQKPGETVGEVKVTEAVESVSGAIAELRKKGYTIEQIAQALSSDDFKILPKIVSQALNKRSKKVRTKVASKEESKVQGSATVEKVEPVKSARFEVKPDAGV